MKPEEKQMLQRLAHTIRGLSMDGVQAANSGHPGLPMGCAEIAAVLYGKELNHNPANPNWLGRDRFVLSAGHGSMLLYSCLHLSGYDLPIEELRNFRQLESMTPGHPEYGEAPGVETTTGPLGQGFATAAGMALGNKIMAARLGVEDEGLLDGQVYVLAGDGCMMEGITNETASLAGHLQLDNLVVLYDSNDICLDGPTAECFTEDVKARFKALGWYTAQIDGHDMEAVQKAIRAARRRKGKPSLIECKTVIGQGFPNKAGTHKIHGAPAGEDEVRAAKRLIGWPEDESFFVPDDVAEYMKKRASTLKRRESSWKRKFEKWAEANAEKAALWMACEMKKLPDDLDAQLRGLEIKADQPGRKASNAVLQKLHDIVPAVVGGSADLSSSDNTAMSASGIVEPGNYGARNIKYGVREFATGAMTSGLALHGMFLPFCGTFLTFSDYMRNAIRLAALMGLRTVYQFTHDSILLGEDGPTHQPVEHVASLRAMPGLTVIRPGDSNEVKAAWSVTLRGDGPVALILSRQNMQDLEPTAAATEEGVARGAYEVKATEGAADVSLFASGSELALALEVADRLERVGKSVRVVSVPSFELFDKQDEAYRASVLGDAKLNVSIEAGTTFGWQKFVGRDGLSIGVDRFGVSAPAGDVAEHLGFTPDQIVNRIEEALA